MLKRGKMTRFTRIIGLVGCVFLVTGLVFIFKGMKTSSENFEIESRADFYLVGTDQIKAYQRKDHEFKNVSDTRLEVVKGQINPVLKRAEISDRYLLFSEEGPPLGVVGRVIALDFKNGNVKQLQTSDYAFTSSGVGPKYYFTSEATTEDSFIAMFDTDLKEVDNYRFDEAVLMSDFSTDGKDVYFLGIPIKDTGDSPTFLYHFSTNEEKLRLEGRELLYEHPEATYFFQDSLVRKEKLYALSSGYRLHGEKDRVTLGQILYYDMTSGYKGWIDLPEIAPINLFELTDHLLAIEHERNDSLKIGFSLFDRRDHSSQFIDLSQLGFSVERDYLKDIHYLDDGNLLILAGNKLIEYEIETQQVITEMTVDESVFHIWLVKKAHSLS